MSMLPEDGVIDFEARLAALETAVSKLSVLLDPAVEAIGWASPIAIPWLKEAAQHEYSHRFWALMDLGESLLKYSASIAFAAAVQLPGSSGSRVWELLQQKSTLGTIAGGLRELLKDDSLSGWPIDAVRRAFLRTNGSQSPAGRFLLGEFVTIRNAEKGHGTQQPEAYWEGVYLRHQMALHDVVRSCDFIRLRLVQVCKVDHLRDDIIYTVASLMGNAPLTGPNVIVSPQKVSAKSTCLWDGASGLFPLDDFVAQRYCSACNMEHIFFAERILDGKVSFHSYTGNHRMTVKQWGT